jgi:hypothetical protein
MSTAGILLYVYYILWYAQHEQCKVFLMTMQMLCFANRNSNVRHDGLNVLCWSVRLDPRADGVDGEFAEHWQVNLSWLKLRWIKSNAVDPLVTIYQQMSHNRTNPMTCMLADIYQIPSSVHNQNS